MPAGAKVNEDTMETIAKLKNEVRYFPTPLSSIY